MEFFNLELGNEMAAVWAEIVYTAKTSFAAKRESKKYPIRNTM